MSLRKKAIVRSCALGFTLGTLWPVAAAADPLQLVTVDYDAAPGCPTAAALDAELRRDLRSSTVPPKPLQVRVRLVYVASEQWQGTVQSHSEQGHSERSLTARDCASLVDGASLIIAMQIDPETAVAHARTPEPSAPPSTPTVPAPAPTPPAMPAPLTPPSAPKRDVPTPERPPQENLPQVERLRVPRPNAALGAALSAWSAVDYGSLPSVTGAFGGALALTYGRLRAETGAGYWLTRHQDFAKNSLESATADFAMWAGNVQGCLRVWERRAWEVSPCLGFQMAKRRASAPSLRDPQTSNRWDPTALTGVKGAYRVTRTLAIQWNIDVLWALAQPRFGFLADGVPTEVFRPAKAQFRGTLGLEWRFF